MPGLLRLCATPLAVLLAVGSSATVSEARIALVDDRECTFVLDGDVSIGDAEQLARLADPTRFENPVLCLNSPGGSFTEALRIIDAFSPNMRTLIRARHECLSACALIFLAGRQYRWIGSTVPDRWLHVGGRLGFHAPYLPVDAPDPRAYTAGVRAIAALIIRSAEPDGLSLFPPDLLAEALQVADPGKFFEIEWIHQAIRWQIRLDGYRLPVHRIDGCVLSRACFNFIWQTDAKVDYRRLKDTDTVGESATSFPFSDQLALRSEVPIEYLPRRSRPWFKKPIRLRGGTHAEEIRFQLGPDDTGRYVCRQSVSESKFGLLIDMSAKNGLGQYTNDYINTAQSLEGAVHYGRNAGLSSAYLLDPRMLIKDLATEDGIARAMACRPPPRGTTDRPTAGAHR